MIMQIIASMVGTIAFAVLFNAPKKEYLICAINGGIAWLAYLILGKCGAGAALASLGATVILTLAARVFSAIRKCPVTVFLITGIFVLVPGAGIYYTAYYLLMNNLASFSASAMQTFQVAGAIALGIVFGFSIPQSIFNKLGRKKNYVGE